MHETTGLSLFRDDLHPQVVQDLLVWERDPELSKLLAGLEATTNAKTFYDAYAEAIIARHLQTFGCELRVEVPTPAGRSCDFEVSLKDEVFYLHVKRIDTERPFRRRLSISSRLRYLEQIPQPYVVSIRWNEGQSDAQMQHFVKKAAEFIQQGRVGEECSVRDDDELELGACRIIAPWDGSHVSLMIGLPDGFIDISPRMQKLLRKAYRQFMPRATNVIMIGSSHVDDADDVETALLGSHIERWDTHPPQGRRVAHGRDADGFWYANRYELSEAAGWFRFAPAQENFESCLWTRGDAHISDELLGMLTQFFGEPVG